MIAIKNWDKEIQQAKEDVIQAKKDAWIAEYRHNNPGTLGIPKIPHIEVKAWFIAQWDTGFIVCDLEELMKLPKRQRDKILKLGGI